MKTLKEIEKEFEECAQSIMSEKEVEQFYRQAIAEILEEVVGEDDNPYRYEDSYSQDKAEGYNQAKAEIRERIKSILE